jgi:hypothetical protein
MNEQSQNLLAAFDAPEHRSAPDGALALAGLGSPEELRPLADELVRLGMLRRAAAPDSYVRTEDGRLAVAGPLEVTLYTRPGCHLCDQAKAEIAPLLREAGAVLHQVNIDLDETLRKRYDVDIPVIFLGPRKVAKHLVNPVQFRRQLAEARRKMP